MDSRGGRRRPIRFIHVMGGSRITLVLVLVVRAPLVLDLDTESVLSAVVSAASGYSSPSSP